MNPIIDGGDFDPAVKMPPWQKHFAWKPVKIHGSYYWLTTVYKRTIERKWPRVTSKFGTIDLTHTSGYTEYGTLFDVLREE